MRSLILAGMVLVVVFSAIGEGATVYFDSDDLGGNRWQYMYMVSNDGLTGAIEEFTIWFAFGSYEDLAIGVPGPAVSGQWDEIVFQPEPVLMDDGAYDAKALDGGIEFGASVGGFVVSFDWLGDGEPGSQLFDVVDPGTLETLESGQTVLIPEPGTLILLGLGAVVMRGRDRLWRSR